MSMFFPRVDPAIPGLHPALNNNTVRGEVQDPETPPPHVKQTPGKHNGMTAFWCPGDQQDCGRDPSKMTISPPCDCCTAYDTINRGGEDG